MPRRIASGTAKPVSRTLSIFLLKEHVTDPAQAIDSDGELRWYALSSRFDFHARLCVLRRDPKEPWWPEFLREWVEGDLPLITTQSSSGILLIQAHKRWFAVAFGYGYCMLKDDSYERRFGLRVTLNCVDPDNLRRVDMRTLDDAAMHTVRQAGRGVPISAFDITASRDVLRGVAGLPRADYHDFARSLMGKDCLVLTAPVGFGGIGNKCVQALRHFKRTDYRKSFSFVDELRTVDDPVLVDKLDTALLKALGSAHPADTVAMTPPETTAEGSLGFTYSTSSRASHASPFLQVEDYLQSLDDRSETALRKGVIDGRHRVYQHHTEEPKTRTLAPVYKCLGFETRLDRLSYVLCEGEWFEVDASLAGRVDKAVAHMQNTELKLPSHLPCDKGEGGYNMRVAGLHKDWAFMDRKNVRPGGASSVLEACDLLTDNLEFIHVKQSGASSKLSHLVKQGENSAVCFLEDEGFRTQLREQVGKSSKRLAKRIPSATPARDGFEVVYAVITSRVQDWPKSIPFFTKLSLHLAHTALNRMNVKNSLVRIHDERAAGDGGER